MQTIKPVSRKHTAADEGLSVVYEPLRSINLDPGNPRVHTDKQVQQIARSIERFGFVVPILVDRNLVVIAGHGRVLAARLLGRKSIPVIRLEHLSDSQRRALLIADNRLAEKAVWDEHLLGQQLKILAESELDFDLEITGFEMGEIDLFIENLDAQSGESSDDADILPEDSNDPPVTRVGDCWLLGRHRVLCGNALERTEYDKLMAGKKAAAVFSDPPYNVPIDRRATGHGKTRHPDFRMASGEMSSGEFTAFLAAAFSAGAANSIDGSLHYHCMDWRHMAEILTAGNEVYSELKNLCVWSKSNAGLGSLYRSQHELIFVFKSGNGRHRNNIQLGALGRNRTNVWEYPSISSFGRSTAEGEIYQLHPTIKPVALVADAILDCSARGDIVLDCFLGSGTSVIAAERTGRICYGVEIEPKYVDVAVLRWQRFTGKSATHEASGRSFAEMEGMRNAE